MHRRARFIWTVNQPIDGAAAFRVFLGRVDQRDDGPNRWFLLQRRLELPSIPDDASLTLTVDGRYQLFVNGTPVGRGPMRCSPLFQRTDTHDLRPWLRQGENVLAVLVHVYGVDTAWYESAKGQWQPVFGDGGLWCEGRARCGAETIEIRSDLTGASSSAPPGSGTPLAATGASASSRCTTHDGCRSAGPSPASTTRPGTRCRSSRSVPGRRTRCSAASPSSRSRRWCRASGRSSRSR